MSNQTVGKRIRIVRKLNRLTGKELAEKIRVTEACISRLEHDAQNPSALLLHVMSLEFNISENWLLTGTGEMFMQADQKSNVRRQYDDKIMKLIEHVITKLEKAQEKMEIDRANSQSPKDDKTSYNEDILSSPAAFCNPERTEFSQRLKALRRQKGVTQRQMAEMLGVSLSAYVKYEHGEREPRYSKLAVLAAYFDVPADILLGRINNSEDSFSQRREGE